MDIRIDTTETGPVRIWVNGELATEITLGAPKTRDQLLADVEHARRLEAMPGILDSTIRELLRVGQMPSEGLKPIQKLREWWMGLEDGLNLLEVPTGSTPPTARPSGLVHIYSGETRRGTSEISCAYKRGYQSGEVLRTLCDALNKAQKPNQRVG